MTVTLFHVFADVFGHLLRIASVGVSIHRYRVASLSAQQIIYRHAGPLALDVPERHVERTNGIVQDSAVAPVVAHVARLPEILDTRRILASPERDEILLQCGHNRQSLIHVRSRADSIEARFARLQLQKNPLVAASTTGGDHFSAGDLERRQSTGTAFLLGECNRRHGGG